MPGFTVLAPAPDLVQKRLGIQLVPGVVWLPICVELAILIEALDIQIIQAKAPQDLTVTAVLDLLGQHASHLLFIQQMVGAVETAIGDRKSTRLNSSHVRISYAVFCLKKKKKFENITYITMLT